MKGSRFTEEQIIGVLREHEAGAKTEEVCRRHGISSPTFYKWKAKYGGLDVSEARRLKALEDENAKDRSPPRTVVANGRKRHRAPGRLQCRVSGRDRPAARDPKRKLWPKAEQAVVPGSVEHP